MRRGAHDFPDSFLVDVVLGRRSLRLIPATRDLPAQQTVTAPRSGYWISGVLRGQDTLWQRFTLCFRSDSVAGVNGAGNPVQGVVRGDSVRFSLIRGDNGGHVVFAGLLHGETLRGTRVETPKGSSTPLPSSVFIATPEAPALAPH